ncbi:MAG TPA: GRP family sugar transporter [bacterium]|nr:GRP family sugar transporter [bacterium]
MALLEALGAVLCLGSYMVPVRLSPAKGAEFMPPLALGTLALTLLFFQGDLRALAAQPGALALALLSGLLWAGGQWMANLALEAISLAKGTLLFSLNTLINILIGMVLFREVSGPTALLGVAAGALLLFGGAWWVSSAEPASRRQEDLRRGIPLALGAGLFWGAYFVPLKLAPMVDPAFAFPPAVYLSGLALGGCLPGLVFALARRRWSGGARGLAAGALSAGLWLGGMAFFLSAIDRLGLARAVPIVNSNALVYAAWSLLVFKEIPLSQTPKVLGGTLLALAGILFLAHA